MVIPVSLKQIRFFYGDSELHFSEGLEGLTGKKGKTGNLDLLALQTYYKERDWFDYDYPDYYRRAATYSYRSVFPLDLSPFDTEDGIRELRVNLTFSDDGSPAGLMALAIRVTEGDVTRKLEGGVPRWNVLPNMSSFK